MNTRRQKARYRIAGISFEQAILNFLKEHPESTAEQINAEVQHPEMKNFSSILSSMRAHGYVQRDDSRPVKWSTKTESPVLENLTEETDQDGSASDEPEGHRTQTVLEAAVLEVKKAERAVARAMESFNSLLPNLDDASRQHLFLMLSRASGNIAHEMAQATETAKESTREAPKGGYQDDPYLRPTRLARRSVDDINTVVEKIKDLLEEHPEGLRSEQIRHQLRIQAKELPRPLQEGLGRKLFGRKGDRRATTYFAIKSNQAKKVKHEDRPQA